VVNGTAEEEMTQGSPKEMNRNRQIQSEKKNKMILTSRYLRQGFHFHEIPDMYWINGDFAGECGSGS